MTPKEQEDWLAWRQTGIGASESPALFSAHKNMTKRGLWLLKTGQATPTDIGLFATTKGGEIETSVRDRYSLDQGLNFQPRLAVHDVYPWIKASLDGYDESTARIIEIKFIGEKRWAEDEIQHSHFIQCQHQMLVTGVPAVDYLYAKFDGQYKKKTIIKDATFQTDLLAKLLVFWDYVKNKIDPGYGPDDFLPITDPDLADMVKSYKFKSDKKLRPLIQKKMTHPKMMIDGIKVTYDGKTLRIF